MERGRGHELQDEDKNKSLYYGFFQRENISCKRTYGFNIFLDNNKSF